MSRAYDAVPWTQVDVGDDGRTLAFSELVLPEGGPWRLDRVHLEEHPEAVVASVGITDAPPARDILADLPATQRLKAPLGRRPVLDAARGRLVGVEPSPARRPLERRPCRDVDLRWPGVIVVAWTAPIFTRLGRVDVVEGAGGPEVALWTWDAGGKLGREDRQTVVPRARAR